MIAASWAPQIPAMAPVKMLPKAKAYIAMDPVSYTHLTLPTILLV